MAANTPKIEDVLAKAQTDLSAALDAARAELAAEEAKLEPLRARVRDAEAALARLTGQPIRAAVNTRDLSDEEKERRAQKRRERRAARRAAEAPTTE